MLSKPPSPRQRLSCLKRRRTRTWCIPQPYCPRCGSLWLDGIVMGLLMVSHWRQTLTEYGPFRFDIEYERL